MNEIAVEKQKCVSGEALKPVSTRGSDGAVVAMRATTICFLFARISLTLSLVLLYRDIVEDRYRKRPPFLDLPSNCHCLFACWQVIFDDQPYTRQYNKIKFQKLIFGFLTIRKSNACFFFVTSVPARFTYVLSPREWQNEQIFHCICTKDSYPAASIKVSLGKGPAAEHLCSWYTTLSIPCLR
jgi:hypothetical protein